MSLESAKEFLKKVSEDNEFKNQLSSAPDKNARMELIKSEGFDFTEEEYEKAKSDIIESEMLDPDMLENVAGGCFCASGCIKPPKI
jgi:predicted ribosomally synthesized peptide with nif11-like leader